MKMKQAITLVTESWQMKNTPTFQTLPAPACRWRFGLRGVVLPSAGQLCMFFFNWLASESRGLSSLTWRANEPLGNLLWLQPHFQVLFLWRNSPMLNYSCLHVLVFLVVAFLWVEKSRVMCTRIVFFLVFFWHSCPGSDKQHCNRVNVICDAKGRMIHKKWAPLCSDEAFFYKRWNLTFT